jgi:hypothetical protein
MNRNKRKDPLRYIGFKKINQEILEFIGYKKRGTGNSEYPYYKCKCNFCGSEYNSFIENLKDARKSGVSCKKCSNHQHREYGAMSAQDAQVSIVYSNYKSRAKFKNWEFSLTKSEFSELVRSNCHYCNQEPNKIRLDRVKGKRESNDSSCLMNGIDRVDSSKGYTIDNSLPCCEDCNKAKRNLNYNDFLELIKNIYLNLKL